MSDWKITRFRLRVPPVCSKVAQPLLAAALLCLAWMPVGVSAASPSVIMKPPLGDRWFGIYFNDERTGFVHTRIEEHDGGFRVQSESAVKMSGLGFSREASVRESYLVNGDLSLRSFEVSQTIDGSPTKVTGEVTDKTVRIVTESTGNRKEKRLTSRGAVYPSAVLNLIPLFRKAAAGTKSRVTMLDVEAVALKEVRIEAVAFERLDDRDTLHLRNDLYPFVDNDIWVDLEGNTLKESVRDGWIETRAEDEKSAREHLARAAISRQDMILDFSLVPVDRPVERPEDLRFLQLALSGFPENVPLLGGPFQKAERQGDGTVVFTVDTRETRPVGTAPLEKLAEPKRYLESTGMILADNPEIVRRAGEILGETKEPRAAAEKLVRRVADSVKDTVTDSRNPVETLRKGTGNCQSHARLYVSLARAAGIPTRFVSGLVYAPGKGFLYHSWAESHVGYWLPLDPTFGQVPADATHVKLVEGESADDLAPLSALIGRLKGKVLKTGY